MSRFLKIAAIVIAAAVVVIIGLSVFVSSYFRGERLKALIIPRMEKATGRTVGIQGINISLLKGGDNPSGPGHEGAGRQKRFHPHG